LERNPPAEADETFGPRVVALFEDLNRRLARDLGPDRLIGHSYFMVPGMDEARLRAVWDHAVRPQLREYFAGREERLTGYEFDRVWPGGYNRTKRGATVPTRG
jgi:hypothetical protein